MRASQGLARGHRHPWGLCQGAWGLKNRARISVGLGYGVHSLPEGGLPGKCAPSRPHREGCGTDSKPGGLAYPPLGPGGARAPKDGSSAL